MRLSVEGREGEEPLACGPVSQASACKGMDEPTSGIGSPLHGPQYSQQRPSLLGLGVPLTGGPSQLSGPAAGRPENGSHSGLV